MRKSWNVYAAARQERAKQMAAYSREKDWKRIFKDDENGRIVKDYLMAAREHKEFLIIAIEAHKRQRFSAEAMGFVKRWHKEIRKLMDEFDNPAGTQGKEGTPDSTAKE